MIDLTVAIVSFNSAQAIESSLSDVMRSNLFSVIVVDNDSTDGSADYLEGEYPRAQILKLDRNEGYGRAANVALRASKSRFVLLLNPDIEVSVGNIKSFFQLSQESGKNAVVYAPATNINELTNSGWHDVDFVLGAAMLFDTQLLEEFGPFDENFFLFYEEKDLCYRIVTEGGRVCRLSDVLFGHKKGTSSGSSPVITYLKQWHVAWSSAYFLTKHNLNRGRFRLTNLLIRYLLKSLFSFSADKRLKYRARCGGMLSYLLRRGAFDESGRPRRIELLQGK